MYYEYYYNRLMEKIIFDLFKERVYIDDVYKKYINT